MKGWLLGYSWEPFLAKHTPPHLKYEKKREGRTNLRKKREEEEKKRGRERKFAWSSTRFYSSLTFEGNFFILWASLWCQNNFLACLYKSRYDSWKIWDLWVWFHGRTKLLKLISNFPASVSVWFSVLPAYFDCFVFRIWRMFLHKSCIAMSLVSPVQISASLE